MEKIIDINGLKHFKEKMDLEINKNSLYEPIDELEYALELRGGTVKETPIDGIRKLYIGGQFDCGFGGLDIQSEENGLTCLFGDNGDGAYIGDSYTNLIGGAYVQTANSSMGINNDEYICKSDVSTGIGWYPSIYLKNGHGTFGASTYTFSFEYVAHHFANTAQTWEVDVVINDSIVISKAVYSDFSKPFSMTFTVTEEQLAKGKLSVRPISASAINSTNGDWVKWKKPKLTGYNNSDGKKYYDTRNYVGGQFRGGKLNFTSNWNLSTHSIALIGTKFHDRTGETSGAYVFTQTTDTNLIASFERVTIEPENSASKNGDLYMSNTTLKGIAENGTEFDLHALSKGTTNPETERTFTTSAIGQRGLEYIEGILVFKGDIPLDVMKSEVQKFKDKKLRLRNVPFKDYVPLCDHSGNDGWTRVGAEFAESDFNQFIKEGKYYFNNNFYYCYNKPTPSGALVRDVNENGSGWMIEAVFPNDNGHGVQIATSWETGRQYKREVVRDSDGILVTVPDFWTVVSDKSKWLLTSSNNSGGAKSQITLSYLNHANGFYLLTVDAYEWGASGSHAALMYVRVSSESGHVSVVGNPIFLGSSTKLDNSAGTTGVRIYNEPHGTENRLVIKCLNTTGSYGGSVTFERISGEN